MAFSLTIEPEWNIISKIRQAIETAPELADQNPDFREAARLTAIELVENALKYSDGGGGSQPIFFNFSMQEEDRHLVISVSNPSTDAARKAVLRATVEQIQNGDPFQLYVQRLEALKDHPDGHSRMGLYRIAYEGEFSLSIDITPTNVKIQAVRPLEDSKTGVR